LRLGEFKEASGFAEMAKNLDPENEELSLVLKNINDSKLFSEYQIYS